MKRFFISLASSSVLWGLVAAFGFYFALSRGTIQNETIARYTTGHPVEYATIAMFCIGMCDLVFKLATTRRERRSLRRGALFPPKKQEKEPVEKARDYLAVVAKARDLRGDSTYFARLTDALNFLKFGGSPDDLDQELRCLADDELDRRDGDYGLVRAFIWAIPILGFLGTVLGITVALGSLDLTQLETTSEKLADGLKVAFDTTALSLSLVFVLFFVQFFSRKQDAILARRVNRLVESELKGRFYSPAALTDASGASLAPMVLALEEVLARQSVIWSDSMKNVAEEIGAAFDRRLCEGSGEWTQRLAEAQRSFVEGALMPAIEETNRRAARFDSLEEKVAQETEALRLVLAASADVAALEERFAQSLERLAAVSEFENTLSNLNATVSLLNSRLTAGAGPFPAELERRAAKRSETLAALSVLDSDGSRAAAEPLEPPAMPPLPDDEPAEHATGRKSA